MGKNNRARRAAKAKQRAKRAAGAPGRTGWSAQPGWSPDEASSGHFDPGAFNHGHSDSGHSGQAHFDPSIFGSGVYDSGDYEPRRHERGRSDARRPEPGYSGSRRTQTGHSEPIFSDTETAELAWLGAARIDLGVRYLSYQWTGFERLARLPARVVLTVAERMLRERIGLLWQNGWQPVELRRQARLASASTAASRLTELAVAIEAGRTLSTVDPIHPHWRAQAEELAAGLIGRADGWLDRWAAAQGDGPIRATHEVIADALAILWALPPIDALIPPPGRRATPGAGGRADRSRAADPVLERVRNLLAKAESTEFEAEAIALTAKAQELITRHAIDVALLSAEDDGLGREPMLIRVPIDPPYADAKSLLAQIVATATRCRAVFMPRVSHSNIVGLPDDLAAVELLFTSLLVQAQHALAEAGRDAPPGSQPRSQRFRSSFLLAYAHRIGERLDEINKHVFSAAEQDSSSFLPVLRSQEDAVAAFMAERFGNAYASAVRGGYSMAGWSSGLMAADQARLNAGHLDAPAD
ncbi:MAG: DUF2786 domain-containing protein [Actinomycetia bacterium]|nr:DUF2786 domain-containing protein [Actinomycetes bacterium]